MSNTVKPAGKDVKQKTPDEFAHRHCHGAVCGFELIFVAWLSIAEGDGVAIEAEDAAVADGDPMGIAGQIFEKTLGACEGGFCVDVPVGISDLLEHGIECVGVFQVRDVAGEDQLIVAIGTVEFFHEAVSKISCQHLHGCEKGLAAAFPLTGVDIEAAVGHDGVDMGMEFEFRIPCMQYSGPSDVDAESFGIGADCGEGLGRSFHQDIEHDLAVGEGDLGNWNRDGEDQVKVRCRQHFLKLLVEPGVCGRPLA